MKYSLTSADDEQDVWAFAHEADGLFTPLEGDFRQVELLGCAPRSALLAALDHTGARRALAGNARLALLDPQGVPMGSYFVNDVTAIAAKPSALGPDLLDVTLRLWCDQALPGSAQVWELTRTGRLNRNGLWHPLGPADRHAWLSVALWSHAYRSRDHPDDAPPGRTYTLDGRHLTDPDGFYCALGEAVNGPCGYFGWNLAALEDCLRGGWGARTPFTLTWRHSEVARSRPLERLDVILEISGDHGVEIAYCA